MICLAESLIPGYEEEELLERTSGELRDIVETELEEAELEDSGRYDLKYERQTRSEGDGGPVYRVEETSEWYDDSEFAEIEMDRNIGAEEIWINVMTGETRIRDADGEKLYNFCGTYEGETAVLSTLGDTEYALLYDEIENSLRGMETETGVTRELGTETGEKTTLMREIEFVKDFYSSVFSQVWETRNDKNYEIEVLPQMREDLDKLDHDRTGTLADKISQVDENINEHGVKPDRAFNKSRSGNAKTILQMSLGSSDRAWFIRGDHIENGEEDVIYGFRVLSHEETENLDEVFNTSSLTGKEYAEKFV